MGTVLMSETAEEARLRRLGASTSSMTARVCVAFERKLERELERAREKESWRESKRELERERAREKLERASF